MSKVLKISKHKLDLAQVELLGPSLLIGRSPLCDQVLRAPGILPVHFLLEWIGEGEFNPNTGMWTLFDMGHLFSALDMTSSEEIISNDLSAEGVIIDHDQQYLGFNWAIVEDKFKPTTIQRGVISNQLKASTRNIVNLEKNKLALEIVSLDKSDQTVKEIWHFFDQDIDDKNYDAPIPFNISWKKNDLAKIIFNEVPKAIFNLKGQKIQFGDFIDLVSGETLIIHLANDILFVRFVNRVDFKLKKESVFKNTFLLFSLFSMLVFAGLMFALKSSQEEVVKNNNSDLLRVVKIVEVEKPTPVIEEKKEIEVPPPEPEIVKEEPPVEKVEPPKEEVVAKAEPPKKIKASPPAKNKANKAKPKVVTKISDVNAVGLFKQMKSQTTSFNQISAETISEKFVDNSARVEDNKQIIVQTSQSNVIKNAISNSKQSTSGSASSDEALSSVQTNLKGAKDLAGESNAPMAKTSSLNGSNSIGSGLIKSAKSGIGKGLTKVGGDGSDVSGGLSKNQINDVINSYRREVRTCYESALLIRNDLNGIMRLSFGINVAGSVTEVKIVNSELDSSILESCIIQVIKKMKFPEAPNQMPTTVIYPFVFKQSS
jgi:TonB family protein